MYKTFVKKKIITNETGNMTMSLTSLRRKKKKQTYPGDLLKSRGHERVLARPEPTFLEWNFPSLYYMSNERISLPRGYKSLIMQVSWYLMKSCCWGNVNLYPPKKNLEKTSSGLPLMWMTLKCCALLMKGWSLEDQITFAFRLKPF